MRRLAPLSLALVAFFVAHGTAYARSFRVSQIPNGSVNGCANCHINPAGGGPRNPFGTTIETSFLSVPGPGGNVLWGPALAQIDSDADGRSNGFELQDHAGSWTAGQPAPGNAALVTLPGVVNAAPVPVLPMPWILLLGASLVGAGARGLTSATRRSARS